MAVMRPCPFMKNARGNLFGLALANYYVYISSAFTISSARFLILFIFRIQVIMSAAFSSSVTPSCLAKASSS